MRKLIMGIVDFRERMLPQYAEKFRNLALTQTPDALFITCSDSRVVPNLFASTEPGDLFVVRNVGNLIPPSEGRDGIHCQSEGAALEFATLVLRVKAIIVCGHSSCGAMGDLIKDSAKMAAHLKNWLSYALPAVKKLKAGFRMKADIPRTDQLSQLNVLQQIEHIRSYPAIAQLVSTRRLRLHAWWFDIAAAEVLHLKPREERFVAIDEREAVRLLSGLKP